MATRYFEDFSKGDQWDFGAWTLEREEMVAFAKTYDPQPIHTDPDFAASTPFGDVIASGWLTTLKCIRLYVDAIMRETAGLASPGLEELRWFKPVKAGEPITAHARVIGVEPSRTRPDRGRVHFEIYGTDAAGEKVMTTNGFFYIAKRPTP